MAHWAQWAEEEASSEPGTSTSDDLERTTGNFRRALRRAARLLPRSEV